MKGMQDALLICLQEESSPRPRPNSCAQQGASLCSESTTGDGYSTKNRKQNHCIFGLKTRRIWKQQMKSVRHKGIIFYLTVLLFLMTVQASNQHDSILWEACSTTVLNILWDKPSTDAGKTQVLPPSSRAQSDPLPSNVPPHLAPGEVLTIQFSTPNHLHGSSRETHRISCHGLWVWKRLVLRHDMLNGGPRNSISCPLRTLLSSTQFSKIFLNPYFKPCIYYSLGEVGFLCLS